MVCDSCKTRRVVNMIDDERISADTREWIAERLNDDEFLSGPDEDMDREEVDSRLSDIPDELRTEAEILMRIASMADSDESDSGLSCADFSCLAIVAMKRYENNHGEELFIPYVWADRPIVIPEDVVAITNGLVGFSAGEECADCIRRSDCFFFREMGTKGLEEFLLLKSGVYDEAFDFVDSMFDVLLSKEDEKGDSYRRLDRVYLEDKMNDHIDKYMESGDREELVHAANYMWMIFSKLDD